jgi:hypothetical protein
VYQKRFSLSSYPSLSLFMRHQPSPSTAEAEAAEVTPAAVEVADLLMVAASAEAARAAAITVADIVAGMAARAEVRYTAVPAAEAWDVNRPAAALNMAAPIRRRGIRSADPGECPAQPVRTV